MEIIPYTDKYKERVIELIFGILENEFGRHSKNGRPDLYNINKEYQRNNGNFWLAFDNENVIGTIALRDCGNSQGFLERMYVKKELRRTGLGTKLLSVLINFAKDKNYKEIFLSTWEETVSANNFYVKNNFEKVKALPENIANRSSSDKIFYKLELK
jgi:N-acetylglutamate synthase-like GNAT family acetyltransferase